MLLALTVVLRNLHTAKSPWSF